MSDSGRTTGEDRLEIGDWNAETHMRLMLRAIRLAFAEQRAELRRLLDEPEEPARPLDLSPIAKKAARTAQSQLSLQRSFIDRVRSADDYKVVKVLGEAMEALRPYAVFDSPESSSQEPARKWRIFNVGSASYVLGPDDKPREYTQAEADELCSGHTMFEAHGIPRDSSQTSATSALCQNGRRLTGELTELCVAMRKSGNGAAASTLEWACEWVEQAVKVIEVLP